MMTHSPNTTRGSREYTVSATRNTTTKTGATPGMTVRDTRKNNITISMSLAIRDPIVCRVNSGLVVLLLVLLVPCVTHCQDISLVYTLPEEQDAGTEVGNISQDSKIRDQVGSEKEFQALSYSFLTEGSNATLNFALDKNSGLLSTSRQLDREKLCRFQFECRLPLRLAVQSSHGVFFKIIDVTVLLTDINDNEPVFSPSVTELSVMENAIVGDLYSLPNAEDADTGANNSVQSYALLTRDVPFRLEMQGSSLLDRGPRLRLATSLDREAVAAYRLIVVAFDGGQPVRSGTLTVNVEVGDVNDNPPSWDQTRYAVNVSETVVVNTVVLYMFAYDADSGANGHVTYRFAPQQPDSVLGLFNLNTTTGELSVVKSLDDFSGQTYTMEIEARDGGSPYKSSRTSVVVSVLDTRNSVPEIILSVFGSSNLAAFSEFSDLGRVVAYIAVKDPDTDLNGIVSCSLNTSQFQLQALDINQYKVIISQPLDRERQDTHVVMVTCADAGSPPLSASRTFTVLVLDENDQVPEFSQKLYYARITESAMDSGDENIYVTTVSASDADVGDNARLSFSILDDTRMEYNVLPNGTVLSLRGLDRETGGSQRYVRIIAFDHGVIANTATATLVITVTDINDNAPQFVESSYFFYVSEGASLTTNIGNVTAVDADEEENAIVLFRLHPQFDGLVPFKVITDGVIKTNGILDRETQDSYEFALVAYDLGRPSLSSTVYVSLRLVDINDNSPVFIFPNEVNNTISVPHTLTPSTAVTTVMAYDVDEGNNQRLVYARDGKNGTRYFDVQPETGEVILVRALTERDLGLHVLAVVAHDLGYPTQLANQTLLYIDVFRGNLSALFSGPDLSYRNALFVFVIVGVTVVLSIVVVVTMVLMRHQDRQRRLYYAKEEEAKVNCSLQQVANSVPSDDKDVPTFDGSVASFEPRRRKEVSFSLDDDNNGSRASGALVVMYDKGSLDTREPLADQLHGQILLEPQVPEADNISDLSCDGSNSDSGRGGSDVEMHSHGGASKDSVDISSGSQRGTLPSHLADSRSSHVEPRRHQSQRSVHFDLYPAMFTTSRGSGRLAPLPSSNNSLSDIKDQRHDTPSFSSFSPIAKYSTPSLSSASSLKNMAAKPTSNLNNLALKTSYRNLDCYTRPPSAQYTADSREGSYIDLRNHSRRATDGEYMDMNGAIYNTSQYSTTTSDTWDGETTTSGSYTVDAEELAEEIDKLFFDKGKDVVV